MIGAAGAASFGFVADGTTVTVWPPTGGDDCSNCGCTIIWVFGSIVAFPAAFAGKVGSAVKSLFVLIVSAGRAIGSTDGFGSNRERIGRAWVA